MFNTEISCKAFDLEQAIEVRYNLPAHSVDIRNLFFACDYMNDCYKVLYFSDVQLEVYKCDCMETEDDDTMTRILVCMYLREGFPDPAIDSILVDVSW